MMAQRFLNILLFTTQLLKWKNLHIVLYIHTVYS